MRSRGSRNDWPPESMLKACIARIVFQHPSVESFHRELQRNPSLMLACGFKLMVRIQVSFNRLLNRAERDCGALSDMFDSLVKWISQLLPDFGTHQGLDGKALETAAQETQCTGHIDARVGRDFQLENHYMRGLETTQMRVALSLSVMLAIACTSIREDQPQRMRSLILPLAA